MQLPNSCSVEMPGDTRGCFQHGNDSVRNIHFLGSGLEREHSSFTSLTTFYSLSHHTEDTAGHHMREKVIKSGNRKRTGDEWGDG